MDWAIAKATRAEMMGKFMRMVEEKEDRGVGVEKLLGL